MPRIESFSFGSIVIGGKTYGHDILILPDGTINRRRASIRFGIGSHVIKKGEINELVKANPEVVVAGTGTNAWAQLASDAELCAKEAKAMEEKVDLSKQREWTGKPGEVAIPEAYLKDLHYEIVVFARRAKKALSRGLEAAVVNLICMCSNSEYPFGSRVTCVIS